MSRAKSTIHKSSVRRQSKGQRNYCFACGKDNPQGMHLKFSADASGRNYFCEFRLGKRYTGPPGHCHGGIIATVLDDAMSKLNRLHSTPAATAKMTVEYLRPVPLHQPIRVESREISKRGRRIIRSAEIQDSSGRVLARSRAVFVVIGSRHVFRKKEKPR